LIIIIVASGISTHTSITVVDTSRQKSPFLNFVIVSSFSFELILPCISQIFHFNSGKSSLISWYSDVAAFTSSSFSDSSIRGVTTKTFCFSSILEIIRDFNFLYSFSEIIFVVIGFLHFGSSSIICTSNSPKNAKAIDLGIGVALICKISGLPNFLNTALCLTQNLCCSSITTNQRLEKSTSSCKSA